MKVENNDEYEVTLEGKKIYKSIERLTPYIKISDSILANGISITCMPYSDRRWGCTIENPDYSEHVTLYDVHLPILIKELNDINNIIENDQERNIRTR